MSFANLVSVYACAIVPGWYVRANQENSGLPGGRSLPTDPHSRFDGRHHSEAGSSVSTVGFGYSNGPDAAAPAAR